MRHPRRKLRPYCGTTNPKYLILTHGHFDHIAGIEKFRREFPGIKVFINPADADKLGDPVKNLSTRFGKRVVVREDTSPLIDGTVLKLGRTSLEVIATPGHGGTTTIGEERKYIQGSI